MKEKINEKSDKRKKMATLLFCRGYLYYSGILTETEAHKVFQRIRAFQDKHKIAITTDQINSIDVVYKD